MSAAPKPAAREVLPSLENGDRLDQKTFHARYEAMPEHVRAQLIRGVVFMASPQKIPHGWNQSLLHRWLDEYAEATPGTLTLLNTTNILGDEDEVEPDACLLIHPDCGGQTWFDEDLYLNGPPELVGEIAWSSESIDLHLKKTAYEKGGVREYVVVALRQKKVYWFVRKRGKLKEISPGADGLLRSETFPGLWLDPAAFLNEDRKRVLEVVRSGLEDPQHAAFVAELAAE